MQKNVKLSAVKLIFKKLEAKHLQNFKLNILKLFKDATIQTARS